MFEFAKSKININTSLNNSPHLFSNSNELTDISEKINVNENSELILKKHPSSSKNMSETTFKFIVSAAKDAIVMMDNNGKVSFWNKAAEKTFGYSEEEMLNKDLHKIITPKLFREASIKGFEKFRKTGEGNAIGKTLELTALRKNGEEFPIELSLSAIKIEEKWNSVGIVRDISDRKERDEKIKTQAAFVNNNPAPVIKSNLEGIIVEANPSAKEIYGSEIVSKKLNTVFLYFNESLLQNLKKNHFLQFEDVKSEKTFLFSVKKDRETSAYYFYGSDISDKKNTVIELKKSEEKFKSLVQNSSLAIYRSNRKGEMLFVNPAFLHMLGYKTIEELKKSINANDLYVHPEEREIFLSILEEEGTIFDFETKLKKKEGTEILVKVSAKIVENLVDNDIIYQGIIQDVSKQKKDEVQIKKLHRAIEQSNVSVVITDFKGKIEYVNPKFEYVTGYTSAEVIGANPSILKSGKQSSLVYKNLWDTIQSGNVWTGELQNKKKSGELFWEVATISPVKDENGTVTNFVAVKEDITKNKLMIEALKENEQRFRITTEASGDAFYRLYENMQYEYMHPNIKKLTGYSPEEFSFSSIVLKMEKNNKPIDRTTLINNRNNQSEDSLVIDYLIKTKSGKLKWLSDRSYPWHDKLGNLIGFMGILTDITEKKEIEEKLIEAKESAETSDRMKTEFISQMSHEIRTPINIILSFIELMKDDLQIKINEEEFENLNTMHMAGKRLIRTIESIMNFSEINSGNYKTILEDIVLYDDILEPIYNEFKMPAEVKSLKLTLLNGVKHNLVRADKYSVHQIFTHLVDNSIIFTDKGNITIGITSLDGKLGVQITDTGIGISEKFLSNIFEPFTQEDHGFSRKYDGNGIGLALVKKYCDSNNIDIKIKSVKNKGTTVQLIFNNSII